MSDAALQVVFDHLHARRRRDSDAVEASLDPDVVHQGVLPKLVCNGRDAVMERMQSSLEGIDSGIEKLELIAVGERVIVGIAGPRFDDIPFLDGEIFMLFTLRDGRILRIDDYRARENAMRAAEAAGP
jgi:ketosteroid isomerase-like protein